jgi:hypothetical protein
LRLPTTLPLADTDSLSRQLEHLVVQTFLFFSPSVTFKPCTDKVLSTYRRLG